MQLNSDSSIYIAGHHGLVYSANIRNLQEMVAERVRENLAIAQRGDPCKKEGFRTFNLP
jgi:hypothetical protein